MGKGATGSDSLCLSNKDPSKSHSYSITVRFVWLLWSWPVKKREVITTNRSVPCQPCSLREKHKDFSRGTVLFPSPLSERLEHGTNNTEPTCSVPEDSTSDTVELGFLQCAPFNLRAGHLGWSFGQTTGHFSWMPKIPFYNFQKTLS